MKSVILLSMGPCHFAKFRVPALWQNSESLPFGRIQDSGPLGNLNSCNLAKSRVPALPASTSEIPGGLLSRTLSFFKFCVFQELNYCNFLGFENCKLWKCATVLMKSTFSEYVFVYTPRKSIKSTIVPALLWFSRFLNSQTQIREHCCGGGGGEVVGWWGCGQWWMGCEAAGGWCCGCSPVLCRFFKFCVFQKLNYCNFLNFEIHKLWKMCNNAYEINTFKIRILVTPWKV